MRPEVRADYERGASRWSPATTRSPSASSASSRELRDPLVRALRRRPALRRRVGARCCAPIAAHGRRARAASCGALDHEREITPGLAAARAGRRLRRLRRPLRRDAAGRARAAALPARARRQLPAPDAAAARAARRPTTAATRSSTTAPSSRRWGRWTTCARWPPTCARQGMALCVDVVLNHTAAEHPWAQAALAGDLRELAFYRTFADRSQPDAYERTLPDVFPDTAPGSFTWVEELGRWVWTTFNAYQWDLDYTNPDVFVAMAEAMLGLAAAGRRRAAPRRGAVPVEARWAPTARTSPRSTSCCRPSARLMRIAAPAVAFKAEAIVAPARPRRLPRRRPARGQGVRPRLPQRADGAAVERAGDPAAWR